MPDTSSVILEVLDEDSVTVTEVSAGGEYLEIMVDAEANVVSLPTEEFLEVYDGSFGGAGGGFSAYVHDQPTPAASWIVTHNLDTFRYPTIMLTGEDQPVWTDVELPDSNTAVIIFPAPASGKAYF